MSLDNVLHMAGGIGIGLAYWWIGQHPIGAILFTLAFGFAREIFQHWDRGFPWLNLHNVGEALSWVGGATLVWALRAVWP